MSPSIRTKFMGILALQIVAIALVGWQGIAGMGCNEREDQVDP